MFITISKGVSGRYAFSAGCHAGDPVGAVFSSEIDFHLVEGLPSTYASYGDAHAFAARMVEERPSCIMAKRIGHYRRSQKSESPEIEMDPEDSMVNHYSEQIRIIEQRFKGAVDSDDRDEAEGVIKELSGIRSEIGKMSAMIENPDNKKLISDIEKDIEALNEKLRDRFPGVGSDNADKPVPSAKTASNSAPLPANKNLAKNVIRAFGEAAAKAIEPSHGEAYLRRAEWVPGRSEFAAVISEPDESSHRDIVRLAFDENMILFGIMPFGTTAASHPLHSASFLERYWLPIVKAVGHVKSGSRVLVASMPSDSGQMRGFDADSGKEVCVKISADGGRWAIKSAQRISKFKEDEVKPGNEVRCVAKHLPTYYGRTGEVVEVLPKRDCMEVRVDFRRGLGPMWLEDKDIELVSLPS